MPIYEYDCPDCRRRVSLFFRTFRETEAGEARCPHCQGTHLRRRISRVTLMRPEGSRLDAYADPALLGALDREDPRAVAGLMRRMGEELGEPLEPEMDEMVGRLEAGESMDAIESTMPDLGAAPSGEKTASAE